MIGAESPGVRTLLGWELRKLAAQRRTYLGIAAAILVPLIFVAAVALDDGGGTPGLPFGAAIRSSGLAVPLVSLSFGAFWLIPLITALVAGDIVAAEHQHATLKTILTRSATRRAVWLAKATAAAAYATVALAVFLTVGLVAGLLLWGWHPLPSPTGATIGPWRGALLLIAAAGTYLLPTLAVTCIALLLSTLTRSSAAAIVGTLLLSILSQLLEVLDVVAELQPYLLSTQFTAWTGLFGDPIEWAPIVRAAWTCGLTAAVTLTAGLMAFVRKDVTD